MKVWKVRISYEFEIETDSEKHLTRLVYELLEEPSFGVRGVDLNPSGKATTYSITLLRGSGREEERQ